jgi:hypothetical protein
MIALSSIAISAYTDLVRLLKDDAASGIEGKPTLKRRGNKAYWYAARRVGSQMRFFYIGEDNDETRLRIDSIEDLRATVKERQGQWSWLVQLLLADHRRDGAGNLKTSKDRDQVAFLIELMADYGTDELARAYSCAMDVGSHWRKHITNSLRRMHGTRPSDCRSAWSRTWVLVLGRRLYP